MGGGVPDEVGGPDEHEVDHDDVVFVGPAVEVVDGVFEDDSQVVDGEDGGEGEEDGGEDGDEEEEVDAAAVEAPFDFGEDVVAGSKWAYKNMISMQE